MKTIWFSLGLGIIAAGCGVYAGKPAPKPASRPVNMAEPAEVPRSNLLQHVIQTMDAAVAGKDPVADRALLKTHNDQTGVYVHNRNNPAFPFHGVTGISVRGDGSNCGHNGTLVSPRIIVTAGHCWQRMGTPAYYQDGQGLRAHWRFLDRNGKVHYAYPAYSRLLTNTITGQPVDTRMFVLSNALPPEVEPALWGSREMVTKAGDLGKLPRFVGGGKKKLWPQAPGTTNYAAWNEGIRGGDSGSGSFVPIETNLVYIGSFGGDVLAQGVNWRETAEWLCEKFGYEPEIPVEVDVSRLD